MSKPIKETSVRTHRKFDPTFKREAVANWLSSGKSARVVAQELGLSADHLYAWHKSFAPEDARRASPGAKPGSVAELQSQLDAALREVARVSEQRDILKKTLGILSEPLSNVTNGSKR
jgi:transposase